MLIGIAGRARSGKDTAAQYLSQWEKIPTYAFAAPLKNAVKSMFDLTDAHMEGELKEIDIPWLGRSPRYLMQTLGTEWGRSLVHSNLWVKLAEQEYIKRQKLIISDVRFENEASWIREAGGVIVHIIRTVAPAVNSHASEAGIEVKTQDHIIWNDDTITTYYDRLDNLIVELRRRFQY